MKEAAETESRDEPTSRESDAPPAGRIGLSEGVVETVPLDAIDASDHTYMFRAALRIAPLVESIKANGILVPVILRAGKPRHQVISGFRRIEAARRAGLVIVPAIVRSDLSDEQAFRAAVLENCQRKTYSDIDRAQVIHEYRRRGHTNSNITGVMGLTARQIQNLASLLDLPGPVQDAIDDPTQHFGTTHALALKQLLGNRADTGEEGPDYEPWVCRVNDDRLSVARLRRIINREHPPKQPGTPSTIFRASDTDWERGLIRLQPVKIRVTTLTPDEKRALKAELNRLLAVLE